jgi:hypothetical protein
MWDEATINKLLYDHKYEEVYLAFNRYQGPQYNSMLSQYQLQVPGNQHLARLMVKLDGLGETDDWKVIYQFASDDVSQFTFSRRVVQSDIIYPGDNVFTP